MSAKEPHRSAETSRYQLVRPLGEGGVGAVYLAVDRDSGEHVALKMLSRIENIPHRALDRIKELIGPGWMPVELALAHYTACDKLERLALRS